MVSILIPAKNESAVISRCLESLKNLDYPKERLEVIVADGLSFDNTKNVASGYDAKVVINDKGLAGSGRNRAYEAASGDIIACTDADCTVEAGWIKNALKYFDGDKVGGVGGVSILPEQSSGFEKAVNFLFRGAAAIRSTSHIQDLPLAKEVPDIPTCNAFYRKDVLAKVMPVDENLLTAEDVWMNFCIRGLGYRLIQAPDVVVWHYRRRSPSLFFRQIYRFAVGRMQVARKDSRLLNIFHVLAGLSIPLFLLSAILFYSLNAAGLFWALVFGLFIIAAISALINTRSLSAAINAPLAIVLFTTAWSAGFLREFLSPIAARSGR